MLINLLRSVNSDLLVVAKIFKYAFFTSVGRCARYRGGEEWRVVEKFETPNRHIDTEQLLNKWCAVSWGTGNRLISGVEHSYTNHSHVVGS